MPLLHVQNTASASDKTLSVGAYVVPKDPRSFLQQILPFDVYFFISGIVGSYLRHFLLLFELSD
jgi:hypothetical protein